MTFLNTVRDVAKLQKTHPKNQKLLDAYSVLAEAEHQKEIVQGNYIYYIVISYTAFIKVDLSIDFYDWNDHSNHLAIFSGTGAGFAFGSGVAWGSASMVYDINALLGQKGNFMATFGSVVTSINLFTLGNESIGSCIGGTLGLGTGLMGGGGEYAKP